MPSRPEARIPEKAPTQRTQSILRSPWDPFGASEWGGETWSPRAPGRGGLSRDRWRVATTKDLRDPDRWWPREAPQPLSLAQLDALQEEWGQARGLPWSPGGPIWQGMGAILTDSRLRSRARAGVAPTTGASMPASVPLLCVDWRFGIEPLAARVLDHLVHAKPLAVQVDAALPEGFADLWEALQRVGADLSGLCAWLSQREEILSGWLAAGRIQKVTVLGSTRQKLAWERRLSRAPAPRESADARAFPFGFGVGEGHAHIPLSFQSLLKPERTMPAESAARERWLVEATGPAPPVGGGPRPGSEVSQGQAGGSSVRRWVEQALQLSFLGPDGWGGWAAQAVGTWHLPARHVSEATEALLACLEGGGEFGQKKGPGHPGPGKLENPAFPLLHEGGSEDLEAVQRLALGKGATLLHTAQGSKAWGQNAMITRQVFTNVKASTARTMAAWATPSLALCRLPQSTVRLPD